MIDPTLDGVTRRYEMTEKKMVSVRGSSIYYDHLAGSIDDAIEKFQDLKTKGYVYFDECENHDGCIIGLIPYFQREETDAEHQARIKGQEIRAAQERKRRLQQYRVLRREFGDKFED